MGDIQFFSSLKVFVVVEEVVATLSPWSTIDAAVLAGLGGFWLAKRPEERFGCEIFIRR